MLDMKAPVQFNPQVNIIDPVHKAKLLPDTLAVMNAGYAPCRSSWYAEFSMWRYRSRSDGKFDGVWQQKSTCTIYRKGHPDLSQAAVVTLDEAYVHDDWAVGGILVKVGDCRFWVSSPEEAVTRIIG